MAETRGLVQRFATYPFPLNFLFVQIGPSPTNVQLFYLPTVGATRPPHEHARWTTEAAALSGALFARREVIVYHDVDESYITGVRLGPG